MAQGKTEQARNYLTKAIEDDSENVFAINLLGELLLQLQKHPMQSSSLLKPLKSRLSLRRLT